jgi:hypothetical protein
MWGLSHACSGLHEKASLASPFSTHRSMRRKEYEMSQHVIELTNKDGKEMTVMMGWDRPLQQFFLMVEQNQDGKEPVYLYNNMDDPDAWGMDDLNYFHEKLLELGLDVPQKMLMQVESDKILKVGNRFVRYLPDGTVTDLPLK